MGVGLSRPLDRDARCATLAPVWSPFVDAFIDTLHARGEAVHPPPPRRPPFFSTAPKTRDVSSDAPSTSGSTRGSTDAGMGTAKPIETAQQPHNLRSPMKPGPVFRPAVKRLVAIGDVHGDLEATKEALRAGGLIDDNDKWCGGKTTAVQVGDQLDRGGDEIAILFLLERLRFEARKQGGELIVMNGNHETLTAAGRFRYADAKSKDELLRWRSNQLLGAAMKNMCGEKPGQCTLLGAGDAAGMVERGRKGFPIVPPNRGSSNAPSMDSASTLKTSTEKVPPGSSKYKIHSEHSSDSWMPRLAAFAPGGPLATRFLAHQPVVVAVGSTVFAHGGVLSKHVKHGLQRVNKETAAWLAGKSSGPPPVHVTGADSVVWARHYSQPESWRNDCDALSEALGAMPGMSRVVVGHTIQGEKGINAACGGKAIRVDVGMSQGCGGGKPQVLEILDDGKGRVSRLTWDKERGEVVREKVEGA